LVALNEGISPVPEGDGRPISLNVCDQLYCVPLTIEPVKVIALTELPEQTVTLVRELIVGVGRTIMLKATGVPWQLLEIGVTITLALIGVEPELVAINGAMEPVPEFASPIIVLELFHSYSVLLTGEPEKVTEVENPLQTIIGPAGETVTEGVGLIRMLNVLDGPLQLLLNGVTVMIV
jgi:hypothetical protein